MTYSKYITSLYNWFDLNSLYSLINEDLPERIGPNYQVEIPEFENSNPPDDYVDESSLIWQPNSDKIDDIALGVYLDEVKGKYGYDCLQALALLFQLDYDTQAAIAEICRNVGNFNG